MSGARVVLLTTLAMLAFAGNSLLGRMALRDGAMDAGSFTVLRLLFGALALWLLVRAGQRRPRGSWRSALALFVYAAAFSYAYLGLDAGAGALVLFGAVQLTMALAGWRQGERLGRLQTTGLLAAMGGLVWLLLPGASAPPLAPALLMLVSGVAWGAYSLLGRGSRDPLADTAGNFLLAVPLGLGLAGVLLARGDLRWSEEGLALAFLSGALTSGVGYALWYGALRGLGAFQAASVQLSVPVLAALAGAALLAEPLTPRLVLASVVVLGGIALMLGAKRADSQAPPPPQPPAR